MTIDEAISHALEVAERYERMEDSHDDKLKEECLQCAADHRQLAEWLTELQEIKAADVQPVVYAHKTINVGRRSYCSNCGKLAIMEDFCSKCGAKVKDGDTE